MNYLFQVKGFWVKYEVNQLGTSEIAMYFYMLEVWNKTGWIDTFKRNNYKVMVDLGIRSYKTLHAVRSKLQSSGILKFIQRNGDANAEYKMDDLSIFYKGSGKGSGEGIDKGLGKGSGKVNINQTKPNQTNNSKSHLGERETNKTQMIFWKEFIKTWNECYLNKIGGKYNYLDKDFKNLKTIYQILEKRALAENIEFTNENLMNDFNFFLNKAWEKDEWIRKNFTVSNVLSQFNQIANGTTNGNYAAKPNNGNQQGFNLVASELAKSSAMEY